MIRKFYLLIIVLMVYSLFPQAKYEPDDGCYLGAFIVNDPVVQGNVQQFEQLTNKKHSVYFSYAGWGQPFPKDWVEGYAGNGSIVQIAFEPNGGLDEVVDGDYIREWARNANKTGAAILLRWACEMNGNWVAWHGNPTKYKEKFRLISTIFKEEAPNVAMVWAPNDIPNVPGHPAFDIHSYYPGDNFVDWVGIDFYGVYFYENGTPERKDPREKLKVVYDVYSANKPIMICEWAATHYTTRVNPPQYCTQYAISQMDSLYGNIKTQFPRLKAVCWFSANTISQNGCNYSLTENASVLNNYRTIVQDVHFQSNFYRNVPKVLIPLKSDTVLNNSVSIVPSIECSSPIDTVLLLVDNKIIDKSTYPPFNLVINLDGINDGFHEIMVVAVSNSGYRNFSKKRIISDKGNNYSVEIIDDIPGSNFVMTGAWNVSTSQPDRYGPYYHFSVSGNGENKSEWKKTIGKTGYYSVYAMWSAHPNRATNAPYYVDYSIGTDSIKVNQKEKGGLFNLLGIYRFIENEEIKISLTNKADGYVIADAVKIEWAFTTSGTEDLKTLTLPEQIVLKQNYPNPFNPTTVINYEIGELNSIKLELFNILGEKTATLVNEVKEPGKYLYSLNSQELGLTSGVYIYRLSAGRWRVQKKLLLIK